MGKRSTEIEILGISIHIATSKLEFFTGLKLKEGVV
jgi:hypothetical protein